MTNAKWWQTAGAVFGALVAAVCSLALARGHEAGAFAFLAVAILVAMMALGIGIVQRPDGILITPLNVISLSRFQAVVWTVVLLGGYGAIAFARLHHDLSLEALDVVLPNELLAVVGISAASLVGSPLVLSVKKNGPDALYPPAVPQGNGQQPLIPSTPPGVGTVGSVFQRQSGADASFLDLFQGDEAGNTDHIDLAKVQMFFVTVVLVTVYTIALVSSLCAGELTQLPPVSQSMVALLAISHAGYLTNKAVDHSK